MEAPEVPIENVQEHIHEHAHHSPDRFNLGVALSTALLAALAAIAALMAGGQANEAMVAQIESANQWSYFQSKSIKDHLLSTKNELLLAMGKETTAEDADTLAKYEHEKKAIKAKAEALAEEAKHALHRHELLAFAVTLFQVAIALGAIAVLTKLRLFWLFSLAVGVGGIAFFGYGASQLLSGHGNGAEHAAAEPAPAHH